MNNDKKNHSEKPWYKRYPAEMMLATQRLNFTQRGIYWTIQDHLWFEIHEGGLTEDYITDICKDAEKDDLYKVLQLFFKKDGDLYYSKHLRLQYEDIIKKAENARKGWESKKKADTINSDTPTEEKAERKQKQSRTDAQAEQNHKTCSIDSNSNSNSNSLINNIPAEFESFWLSLPMSIRQRSSKPKSVTKYKRLKSDLQKLIINTYPLYCSQQGQYAVALERFIENEKYNEVQTPQSQAIEEKISQEKVERSRIELAYKQGRPLYNMTQTEYETLLKKYGYPIPQ